MAGTFEHPWNRLLHKKQNLSSNTDILYFRPLFLFLKGPRIHIYWYICLFLCKSSADKLRHLSYEFESDSCKTQQVLHASHVHC